MKNLLIFAFLWLTGTMTAQLYSPVSWQTEVEKVSEDTYILKAKATIETGWHLYSQEVPEDGPIPTTFTFENENAAVTLIGETTEEEGVTVFDDVFELDIKFFEQRAVFEQKVRVNPTVNKLVAFVEFMVCDDEKCLPPTEEELVFTLKALSKSSTSIAPDKLPDPSSKVSLEENSANQGLWSLFIVAFLFGFTALLTPCVFPMIPLTVSFFTKQSKNKAAGIRNAIFYGVSIIVIYVLLGTAVTAIFGSDALNALATNVWFNLFFFLLLVIFALSFLGAFEINLPSSWANKVDEQSYKKGGLIGVFFMALALAIVSFSCTGPIVGTLLVESASGGVWAPMIGMLGFSLAIALPFTLFAAFPGWLNSLPKSGGWLNSVKVVLGFLELAFAFKFLSQADLVLQLHLLEREVFIAIWIAIFGALSLYLLGKLRLPHDSPLERISVSRLMLALLSLSFTIYLIPGLWGAPLQLISAFPPPLEYSESPYGVGYAKTNSVSSNRSLDELAEGAHLLPPHDILTFNDYDQGLAYAKKVNKPVLIDFTGWACVNCRKMEQNVWPDPKVLDILKNKVVLISLYVDDKRKLPADQQVASQLRPGRNLTYIGQKWSEFQATKYKANSQPFYVLIGHDEANLNNPIAYTPNIDRYYKWLTEGLANFRQNQSPF